jgi:hypothetical protein
MPSAIFFPKNLQLLNPNIWRFWVVAQIAQHITLADQFFVGHSVSAVAEFLDGLRFETDASEHVSSEEAVDDFNTTSRSKSVADVCSAVGGLKAAYFGMRLRRLAVVSLPSQISPVPIKSIPIPNPAAKVPVQWKNLTSKAKGPKRVPRGLPQYQKTRTAVTNNPMASKIPFNISIASPSKIGREEEKGSLLLRNPTVSRPSDERCFARDYKQAVGGDSVKMTG